MTSANYVRWSGWGMVLAAICLLATFLTLPASLSSLPFFSAILFVTFGLIGLYVRYSERADLIAKLALGIGVLGGLVGLGSTIGLATGFENGRTLMNYSIAVMFSGLFVFGCAAMQQKLMPRGNTLPMLAGFWFPLIVIGSNVYHPLTRHWLEVPGWLSFTLFAIMGVFLALLGYFIQADTPSEQVALNQQ